jgi:hypothetical protein
MLGDLKSTALFHECAAADLHDAIIRAQAMYELGFAQIRLSGPGHASEILGPCSKRSSDSFCSLSAARWCSNKRLASVKDVRLSSAAKKVFVYL